MAKAFPRVVTDINGLSEEQMRFHCPAIFAEGAHESRSAKYRVIPTIEVLQDLFKYGFVPTTAMQSLSRDEVKRGFTRHLVRLTPKDALGYYDARGNELKEKREVVLVNSYDGTSAYELRIGIFRMVCSNGMIVGDDMEHIKILHKGNADDISGQVVEGSLHIIEQSAEVMESIEEMKQVQLDRQEQLLLAKYAMEAKFGVPEDGEDTKALTIFQPQDMLRTRRREDRESKDIWTVGNVIEENLIQGRVSRVDARGKKHTTHAVNSIKKNLDIHERLWMFQKEMLAMKKSQH